jgi:hypothetical protein
MTRGKDSNPLSFWRDNAAQNDWPDIHQELCIKGLTIKALKLKDLKFQRLEYERRY